jgi:NitT/TauT family transport system substrate-binding protein
VKKTITLFLAASLVLLNGCTSGSSEPGATSNQPILAQTSLEPKPLDELRVLKVSSGGTYEFLTALIVADELGEFEKENISIEYVTLPSQDALPALALGQLDVSAVGVAAPFFNSVSEGAEIRLVYPGPSTPNGDGLWVRKDFLQSGNLDSIVIASSQGIAWLGVSPVKEYLEDRGFQWSSVKFQKLPLGELATALELGTVDAAWLNSPAHIPFETSGVAEKVAGYASSEIATGYAFGPNLLDQDPVVGQAFIRALLRTVRTHLSGDYKSNEELVRVLSERLGVNQEALASSGNLLFGEYLDSKLLTNAQAIWIEFGGIVSYSAPLEPDDYIDQSYVDSFTSK